MKIVVSITLILFFNLFVNAQFADTIIVRKISIEKIDSNVDAFIPISCRVGFFNGKLFSAGEIEINSIRIPLDVRKGVLELNLKNGNYLVVGYHPSGISPSPTLLKVEVGYRYEVDIYLRPSNKPIICNF